MPREGQSRRVITRRSAGVMVAQDWPNCSSRIRRTTLVREQTEALTVMVNSRCAVVPSRSVTVQV